MVFYDVVLRTISRNHDGSQMGVIHLYVDTKDAMGANIINQVCEGLKDHIEEITSEKVTMCIVSNLSDTKCIEATVTFRKD